MAPKPWSEALRPVTSISASVLVVVLLTASASAQGLVQDCAVNDYVRPAIAALRTDKNEQRIATGRKLVESWRGSLTALMQEISQLPKGPVSSWSAAEKQYATALTDTMKTILATTDQAIQAFRQCDSDRVVKRLAWAARGDETVLRINSANILGNVADNTTVCFVLHHLRDPSINVSGRANLLGVAVAVAGYAHKENVQAITDTLAILAERLKGDNLGQTQKLVLELGERARRSTNANVPLPDALASHCRGYSYSGPPPE
jgi:hypothetical protein